MLGLKVIFCALASSSVLGLGLFLVVKLLKDIKGK